MTPDRRLHAFRPDLAESGLQGIVAAERYSEGVPATVSAPLVSMRPKPDIQSGIDTELLHGETVTVFDVRDGWAWVKADLDGYVGYIPQEAISHDAKAPTHRIRALRTFVYPAPDLRLPVRATLSMASLLHVTGETETRGTRYLVLEDGSAIIASHCLPFGQIETADPVSIATRFIETPYLWGGRSGFGIDCSGLVQMSMTMTGHACPRDSDMQAASLGREIDRSALQRGDLIFWKGHVGFMEDASTLLHANGHTMTVARENLDRAIERIGWLYQQPTAYRRPLG